MCSQTGGAVSTLFCQVAPPRFDVPQSPHNGHWNTPAAIRGPPAFVDRPFSGERFCVQDGHFFWRVHPGASRKAAQAAPRANKQWTQ